MRLTILRKTITQLAQRPWFAAFALLILAAALVIAFVNIFNYRNEGQFQTLLWITRLALVAAVVLIWILLNLPQPRVLSTKFAIIINEFGEEPAPGYAEKGVLKPARRRSVLSTFEDVRLRLPGGSPADGSATTALATVTQTRAVATRMASPSADAGGNAEAVRSAARDAIAATKGFDINTLSGRVLTDRAIEALNELPTGGREISTFSAPRDHRHTLAAFYARCGRQSDTEREADRCDVISPAPYATPAKTRCAT